VRIAYLDESGRSRHEPIIVVAGVIVHGDRSYRKIEEALDKVVEEEIPESDREGFVLHANHLFHGNNYFDKGKWPRERRFPVLERLARLPAAFGLPIVFGSLIKAPYRAEVAHGLADLPDRQREEDTDIGEHMSVMAQAEIQIELQMHEFPRDEICMLVAEDTDRIKRAVKDSHTFLRDPKRIAGTEFAGFPGLPLRKIVDTPHFASKTDSKLLQLADMCAFLIMRRLTRQETSQPFFEVIAPQIFRHLSDFGDPMGSERISAGQRY
jgi:hypothetical protein